MKKETLGIIILLIAVLALVVFINKETSSEYELPFFNKEYPDNKTEPEEENTNESSSGNKTDQIEKDDSSETYNESDLPEDINETECGYYYKKYGVCGGTCLEGECVSKGRSCYCLKS